MFYSDNCFKPNKMRDIKTIVIVNVEESNGIVNAKERSGIVNVD